MNRVEKAIYDKEYNLINKEKISVRNRQYREENIEIIKNRRKRYYQLNKARINEKSQKYYLSHRIHIINKSKEWRENNPEKRLIYHRQELSTPNGKLNHSIRGAIRKALKGMKAGRHWETLVGYTLQDLKQHLEGLFTLDMNWNKFMKGEIHIDHIKPKSLFNYETAEDKEFRECWALENLQPLYAMDNLKKSNHYSLI